jgi:truncated hemoglobin YjbI
VTRRPDPARIRRARHDALRNRLIGDGLTPDHADRWISAWAERAGEPESAAEFDAAYEWIVSELAGGARR